MYSKERNTVWFIHVVTFWALEIGCSLQSQSCVPSYFKGGVEGWRVAGRSGQWGLSSCPGLDTDLWDRGITSNQPWGPPTLCQRQALKYELTYTQTHTHKYLIHCSGIRVLSAKFFGHLYFYQSCTKCKVVLFWPLLWKLIYLLHYWLKCRFVFRITIIIWVMTGCESISTSWTY